MRRNLPSMIRVHSHDVGGNATAKEQTGRRDAEGADNTEGTPQHREVASEVHGEQVSTTRPGPGQRLRVALLISRPAPLLWSEIRRCDTNMGNSNEAQQNFHVGRAE